MTWMAAGARFFILGNICEVMEAVVDREHTWVLCRPASLVVVDVGGLGACSYAVGGTRAYPHNHLSHRPPSSSTRQYGMSF